MQYGSRLGEAEDNRNFYGVECQESQVLAMKLGLQFDPEKAF